MRVVVDLLLDWMSRVSRATAKTATIAQGATALRVGRLWELKRSFMVRREACYNCMHLNVLCDMIGSSLFYPRCQSCRRKLAPVLGRG